MHEERIYLKEKDLLAPIYNVLQKIKLTDKQIGDLVADLRRTNESKDRFFESALKELRTDYDNYEKRKSKLLNIRIDEEITKEAYDEKLKEYEAKQANITTEMKKHQKADEEYYLTVNMILSLAQRAYQVFKSSEPLEKRQLLNFLLQNCQLQGEKLNFELKTPFDRVLEANRCSTLLPR